MDVMLRTSLQGVQGCQIGAEIKEPIKMINMI